MVQIIIGYLHWSLMDNSTNGMKDIDQKQSLVCIMSITIVMTLVEKLPMSNCFKDDYRRFLVNNGVITDAVIYKARDRFGTFTDYGSSVIK